MEGYIWLILASMLAVGVLIGFVAGRNKGDASALRIKELEEQLGKANQEMQIYRGDVSQHFEKTATLFNQLTNNYCEVYEHLANSSEQLCGDQVAKLKSLTSESKILEVNDAEMQPSPEQKESAPPVVEKKIAIEAESTAEAGAEVEVVVPRDTEATSSTDQQADEARIIH